MDHGEVRTIICRKGRFCTGFAGSRCSRNDGRFLIFLRAIKLYVYSSCRDVSCETSREQNGCANHSEQSVRFYGMTENAREVKMDMDEMVSKVKAGEPLYGESRLTPHMQGVAARQSRYSALFTAVVPWFNFVNHNQHGVDTAKYYRQAEVELEAERQGKTS